MTGRSRFAEWLDVSMDNEGMSKRELGQQIGMDSSNITHWVKGRSTPTPPTITKIAQVFGVPPVQLLVTARPEEFPEEVYGPPLEVPYDRTANRKAQELLDQLSQLTSKVRAGDGVDNHTLEALNVIRDLVKEDGTQNERKQRRQGASGGTGRRTARSRAGHQ